MVPHILVCCDSYTFKSANDFLPRECSLFSSKRRYISPAMGYTVCMRAICGKLTKRCRARFFTHSTPFVAYPRCMLEPFHGRGTLAHSVRALHLSRTTQ